VDVPQTADVGVGLEALEGDAVFLQAARTGQALRAGADERDLILC